MADGTASTIGGAAGPVKAVPYLFRVDEVNATTTVFPARRREPIPGKMGPRV